MEKRWRLKEWQKERKLLKANNSYTFNLELEFPQIYKNLSMKVRFVACGNMEDHSQLKALAWKQENNIWFTNECFEFSGS
jgi:hypothetical protein